jgi:hypothetical protein
MLRNDYLETIFVIFCNSVRPLNLNKEKAPYSRRIRDRLTFKNSYLLAFLYLFMLLFLASADSWAADPFQQASDGQGLVSIEAEHYHSHTPQGGHEWLAASQAGYSGEGALEAYPADRTSVATGYASTTPRLDYQVEFVTTGTHYIWVRGFGPSTASDSLHVGLNGAEVSSADNLAGFSPTKQWVWSNQRQSTGAVRTLNITSVGVHTINVWMRESGMVVDKLVLTKDASYVPSGPGPAESPRSGDGLPTVATPTITPHGGTFTGSVTVALATETSDAVIYYTLNGSDPTPSSTLYSSPFELTASATVKARAFRGGYNDSALASAAFQVVSSNMLHYWKLDETGGSVYQDLMGAVNARCSADCPDSVMGLVRRAQEFNGTANELNVANAGSLDWASNANFSIEFWINKDAACLGREAVIGRHDPETQLHWWIGCEDGKAAFYLFDKSGNGPAQGLVGTKDIADGAWHHIVAIRDNAKGKNRLYVDGIEEASVAASYSNGFDAATAELNVGWLNDSSWDYHFAGIIDEVAIHNEALSNSVISRHYMDGTIGLQHGYWGCGSTFRIMPLGDSNTQRRGYRPKLYFDLANANYDVNFVGSMSDTSGSHDRNHEGHSGWTPAGIAASLYDWLVANPPQVVLLHIGTNELDIFGVEDILNVVDSYSTDITVVLARIINRATYHQPTTDFNAAVAAMAQARISNGDKILIVNHESALIYPNDMEDELHPNSTGFAKMAVVWFDGLTAFLPACGE